MRRTILNHFIGRKCRNMLMWERLWGIQLFLKGGSFWFCTTTARQSMSYHPHVFPSNSISASVVSNKWTLSGAGSMSSSNSIPWFLTRAMPSAWLEAFKTSASIGYPGADGGAFELWISGGVGSGSISNHPSDGPSSRANVNLLAQWRVSLGTVAEEKKTALYEILRRVTWDLCFTRRFSNRCVGRSFGKCALTNADGRRFLRITEHCAPFPRRGRRRIGVGVRRIYGWGGVSDN